MKRQQALVLATLLAGCASGGPTPANHPNTPHYDSDNYGVQVYYPADVKVSHDFAGDYLLPPRWNPDADAGMPGEPLLSLELPQSNHLLDARLRLGASDDARATEDCREPDDGNAKNRGTVRIGGIEFKRVDSGDAAMNHFLHRRSYRAVSGRICYAIDLVVSGVNPGVYADKPTPPMTQKQAFKRLSRLLDGISIRH